jgi:hypothetical protein
MQELEAAGLAEVRKGPSGKILAPDYMLKLLNFVTQHARKRREGERKEALEQRRAAFRESNWETYREIIKDQFMKEDQMCQLVMKETLDVLTATDMEEFQMTMAHMAQTPEYAQMIMAAQQGKLPDEDALAKAKSRPKLDRAKTLKAFAKSKTLTIDAMQA